MNPPVFAGLSLREAAIVNRIVAGSYPTSPGVPPAACARAAEAGCDPVRTVPTLDRLDRFARTGISKAPRLSVSSEFSGRFSRVFATNGDF